MLIKIFFNLLSSEDKKRTIFLVITFLSTSILDVVGIASLLPFITILLDTTSIESSRLLQFLFDKTYYLHNNKLDFFIVFLGSFSILLIVFSTIARSVSQYYMNLYVEKIRVSLSTRLFNAYLYAPYPVFFKKSNADISKTVITEVDYFIDKVFRPTSFAASHLIFSFILISLLFYVDVFISITAILTFGLFYLFVYKVFSGFLYDAGDSLASSMLARHKHVYDSISMIKTIKVFRKEEFFFKKYTDSALISAASQARFTTTNQISSYLAEGVIFVGVLTSILIVIYTSGGTETKVIQQYAPIIALFTFAGIRMKPSLQNIYQGFSSLKFGEKIILNLSNSFSQIKEFRLLKSNTNQYELENFKDSIVFKDVSFKYLHNQKQFEKINLEIAKNQKIGIMGKSGSGKSTLLDLLLGLSRPDSGKILVDGMEMDYSSLKGWHALIGYVPQEVSTLEGSLVENISLENPKLTTNLEALNKIIEFSRLENLKKGISDNNDIRSIKISDITISGGQKQRIGIARALFNNPEILIFDEITSSLDKATEKEIIESIYSLSDKTIFIVSHNENILYGCDRVLFIENGKITEL